MGVERADELGALVPGGPPTAAGPGGAVAGGPLTGVRFVAKDMIDVAGMVTGAGNPNWASAREPASRNAASVDALLGAGAELVGKGQCSELAFSLSGDNAHYGMPRNPDAPERDPGGSTSGPAAATAGGLCELGLGTDTLGSVRVPASYCGLYGFRPTHGAISVAGVLPLAQRFDTVGLLAREPDVLSRAAAVLIGARATGDDHPPRRLLLLADALATVDPDISEATRDAAQRLASTLGAMLQTRAGRAPETPGPAAAAEAFTVLQRAEVWRNFGGWVRSAQPSLGPDVAARMESAARIGPTDVAAAEPVAAAVAAAVRDLEPDQAIVIPSAGSVAPPREARGDAREDARVTAARLTCLASLAGAPAVSLPLARVSGLAVGVGLVAAPRADRALLAAATRAGDAAA